MDKYLAKFSILQDEVRVVPIDDLFLTCIFKSN